ncbi:hypothetical protein NDU88_007166 [Pleurodeles waltl]|uniref:Uncharacterized protein n=1 Tax=Pleurodeles waltl TaxID=8319 RepID=A0AAV7SRY8_PLEWA|nr:hypothetical protein NDU88_007166 [Pleurodeles waltl]
MRVLSTHLGPPGGARVPERGPRLPPRLCSRCHRASIRSISARHRGARGSGGPEGRKRRERNEGEKWKERCTEQRQLDL